MAYEKQTWEDYPSTNTPITSNRLNHIEQGIYDNSTTLQTITTTVNDLVNDLVNYYTKTETFTKQEVNNLISAITTMDIQIVQTLPVQDISTTTIYLVPKTTAEQNDAYDEYIYVSNAWEHIGSTEVDLTNYVTNTDYATTSTGGVIKVGNGLSLTNGVTYVETKTFADYTSSGNGLILGKGTFENVITGKNLETGNNKVTTISSSSTNTQYPSAKAVYDYIQSLNGNGVSY